MQEFKLNFMPQMITGKRGSGKTHKLVEAMVKYITMNPKSKVVIMVLSPYEVIKSLGEHFNPEYHKVTHRLYRGGFPSSTRFFIDNYDAMSPERKECISSLCEQGYSVLATQSLT